MVPELTNSLLLFLLLHLHRHNSAEAAVVDVAAADHVGSIVVDSALLGAAACSQRLLMAQRLPCWEMHLRYRLLLLETPTLEDLRHHHRRRLHLDEVVANDEIQVEVAWDVDIQDDSSDVEEACDRTLEGTCDDRVQGGLLVHLRGEVDDEDGLLEGVAGSSPLLLVLVGSGDAGGASGAGTAVDDQTSLGDTVLLHPRQEEVAVRELVRLQLSASSEPAEEQQQ